MHHRIKTIGLSLFVAAIALWSGSARSADLLSGADLLARVSQLQDNIAALEDTGQINHGQAAALGEKLDKVSRVLSDLNTAAPGREISAQQQGSFLKEIEQAIDALLGFVKDLTKLLTDLPADVVQPIINAAVDLLQQLIALLLG